jgi:hypothetical protein
MAWSRIPGASDRAWRAAAVSGASDSAVDLAESSAGRRHHPAAARRTPDPAQRVAYSSGASAGRRDGFDLESHQ